MNLLDTLRGLARRWYIVVPGILLAIGAALGAWMLVPPAYERTASQLLLPGLGTLPEGASNPYLYLGGLSAPADVLVRAIGSEDALRSTLEEFPGAEIEITRDPAASGPVVLMRVTARTDSDAGAILEALLREAAVTLNDMQADEGIPARDRITITQVSIDTEGTVQQRQRLVASVGAGLGVLLLALVLASVIDGLATRSARKPHAPEDASGEDDPDDGDEPLDAEPESAEDAVDAERAERAELARASANEAPD